MLAAIEHIAAEISSFFRKTAHHCIVVLVVKTASSPIFGNTLLHVQYIVHYMYK